MASPIITIAPTGPIATRTDNPHLPTQPTEIADAVADAFSRGAAVAHLHFRDDNHLPTADLEIARTTIELIRERCPILIQVSTGVGLQVPLEQRAALLELRPQMATLNPCTMNFGNGVFHNPPEFVASLARRMQELNIRPELEIYDSGHLDACLRLRDAGLLDGMLQFSIVLGVVGGMSATMDNLVTVVKRLPPDCVWQVIAIGRNNLELTAAALAMGGNARAGLEDCLYLRRGELATNAALMDRTAALIRALDKTPAGIDEAHERLHLVSLQTSGAGDIGRPQC
jgi:3-keto-5-aminohexanoate cleavage enzyme